MSFPDLRAFLDQLHRANDVVFIDALVDPVQEAAEIHRRVIAAGGPALATSMLALAGGGPPAPTTEGDHP